MRSCVIGYIRERITVRTPKLPNSLVLRGERVYRPWYLHGGILNRINQKIAKKNLKTFPRMAIFSFDNIGLVINLEGRYEADSLEVLGKFLKEYVHLDFDSTAVDVGANIGNHSVFLAGLFSNVLAFEPNPQVFALLQLNTLGRQIIPLNYGLSNIASNRILSIDRENLGASRITGDDVDSDSNSLNTLGIEVCRLDDVAEIDASKTISLIKIDVEGHELAVLEGAVRIIERERPVIVFEQDGDSISNGTSQTIEFLRQRDYQLFTIRNNFYLGQRRLSRYASFALRLFFGHCKEIVRTVQFEKKFYDMIIAVPDSTFRTFGGGGAGHDRR